ncbi:peroxide stress protein YaaA [Candidatus Williamhamiltonella defendens]|nr:peroxide stress protein YaaA [Candidatus Hamiltonella defensa]
MNAKGKELYAFWQNNLTKTIHQAIKDKDQGDNIVINLASKEYF